MTDAPAPLMLSVSGARGIVGRSMTPTVVTELATAFGATVRHGTQADGPLVVLGRDSRPSGPALGAAATAGLLAAGCRVVDLGVVPTPTVGLMVSRLDAGGGLVITASHNPIEWNGVKLLNGEGVAPPAAEATAILDVFRDRALEYVGATEIHGASIDDSAVERHVESVLRAVDGAAVKTRQPRVVLDSVNGAGGAAARCLLDALGCEVVHLNAEPTGYFAHSPEPLRENLTDLARETAAHEGVAGFAQDPDADRLAIVDERGTYIGEEMTLAIAAQRWLQVGGHGPIVANLSTSRMVDDIAAAHGTTVIRTPVGEAHVVAAMKAHGATLGGEGNGGVVLGPVVHVRDSLGAMALVLSAIAADGPLSSIVAGIPGYDMIKRKFDIAPLGGAPAVPPMIERLAERYADRSPNRSDGIRIDFDDSWVHFRASNTEPIVRLIAEAPTAARAEALVAEVATLVALPT